MATTKITDLTAYTDPVNTDVLPIVDVTSDVTKKVSVANVMKNASLGTAAAPGISFDGDPNTGVYSPGADQVAVTTGGTQRLLIDSAGAVTIAGDLTVNGTTTNINTQNLVVEDKNIVLGDVTTPTDVTADGGGITLKGTTDKTINWVDSTDAWTSSERFSYPTGSAAAPTLTFTGDANTGIYSPGADQVAISTGGSGRLFINSSGQVGVGTTSPGYALDVVGAGDAEMRLRTTGTTSSDDTLLRFSLNNTAGSNYIYFGDSASASVGAVRYNHSTDALSVDVNASERLRITSAGLVGVGTSSPSTNTEINAALDTGASLGLNEGQLSIGREANSGGAIRIGYDTTNNFGFISSGRVGVSWDKLILNAGGGNVGIGTSAPTSTLHIQHPAQTTSYWEGKGLLIHEDATANQGIAFYSRGSNEQYIASLVDDATSYLIIGTRKSSSTNNVDALTIRGDGKVGIGTTNPQTALHLTTSGAGQFRHSDGTRSIAVGSTGSETFVGSGANLTFLTNGLTSSDEKARIDTSGRLLVGTSTGTSVFFGVTPQLQVEGTNENTSSLSVFNNQNSATGAYIAIGKSRGTSTGSSTIVNSGDAIGGIYWVGADGTDRNTPAAQINCEVDGTPGANDMPGRLVFSTTADGASSPTERMRIGNDGYVYIKQMAVGGTANMHWSSTAGQLFVTSSSLRFKKDIVDYDKGLAEVMQMQPKYFVYNQEPGGKRRAGFIAEDFHDLGLNEYVEYWKGEEGEDLPSEIGYSNMVAILVKAIQELKAEVDDLKSQLA